jgi:hypothetical protein
MLKGESVLRVESDQYGESVTYPPELLPAMQSALKFLADLALEHEQELAQLESSATHPELKRQFRIRLEEAYSRRRAPCLRYLSELQFQALASLRPPKKELARRRWS